MFLKPSIARRMIVAGVKFDTNSAVWMALKASESQGDGYGVLARFLTGTEKTLPSELRPFVEQEIFDEVSCRLRSVNIDWETMCHLARLIDFPTEFPVSTSSPALVRAQMLVSDCFVEARNKALGYMWVQSGQAQRLRDGEAPPEFADNDDIGYGSLWDGYSYAICHGWIAATPRDQSQRHVETMGEWHAAMASPQHWEYRLSHGIFDWDNETLPTLYRLFNKMANAVYAVAARAELPPDHASDNAKALWKRARLNVGIVAKCEVSELLERWTLASPFERYLLERKHRNEIVTSATEPFADPVPMLEACGIKTQTPEPSYEEVIRRTREVRESRMAAQ